VTVAQNAGIATINVSRTGSTAAAASVSYATTDGTAAAGTDYTATSGTLSWTANDSTAQSINVPISNATPFTGSKTFTVSLSDPSTGATLGSPASATVSITGDGGTPVASPGTIELSATSYAVEQSSGSLTITVIRSGGSSGAASIHYATAAGTATAGTDFTAASGTLSWASGDASSKTFTVAISTATPFSGTKSFTVTLSAVSGGTLGTPASSTVTISGSSVASNGGTAPSAPSSLTMVAQGLNTATLSWSVAAPGAAPIAHYNIYRNGSAYATSIATTYIDTNATNTNSPETGSGPLLTVANTVYTYAVSAVDTAGNEGPLQSNLTYWVYYNGIFDWLGDYSYPGGQININYADTTGAPEDGPADIKITSTTTAAGWLPYAGKTTTQWDLDGGAFNYISLDLKPTLANQDWQIFILCRLPPGDNAPWSSTVLSKYGPAPVVGQWATYKIPLSVLTIGYTNFTGSIKGNTLTVTSVTSGVGLDAGGYITGPGIPAGTYLTTYNQQGGGVGTYTVGGPGISSSTNIASTSMVEQRNGIYKFALVDRNASNPSNNAYYVDNVKFTVD